MQPTTKLIAGLNNKLVPVQGEIKLPITLGGSKMEHTFILCEHIENEFLIGMDVLKRVHANIDIPRKKVITPYGEDSYFDKPKRLHNRCKVRCNKTVTIPANSAGYLQGKMAIRNCNNNYEGTIEASTKLANETGVFITGSLVYSNQNMIPVHYVNVMPHDVTIRRNEVVAFVEPVCYENSNITHGVNRVKHEQHNNTHHRLSRLPDADTVDDFIKKGKWEKPEELHKQLKIDEIAIPARDKSRLKELITEFSHCFARDRFDLGKATFYEAKIDLKPNYVAKWIPSRPVSYKMEPRMDMEIERMINSDQITSCPYSLWNSRVYLLAKRNSKGESKFRFVQDGRALDSQSIQDCYELPRIKEKFDRINNCEWISSFDFQSGFTQIGLVESSQPLTAFTYKGNRYMSTRLIQGHKSSSASFSRCMNLLFSGIPFETLILYVDDMLVWSKNIDSHLRYIRLILERLTWGGLKLSGAKTSMFQKSIKFLGHIVSKKGLQIDENRIKAIQALPAPTTVKKLQKFIGVMNYNRIFLKGFAEMAAPLYNLLRKGVKFEWTKECQDSFQNLKAALLKEVILAVPDISDKNQSYHVTVDSSKTGQGATLSQMINGKRRVIAYWSRAVPKHQQKMGATKLELIALHGALKYWELYLKGTKFKVYTDCAALLSMDRIFKNENSFFQRRLADMSIFNFQILHISGKSAEMKTSDFLSRYQYDTTFKESSTQTNQNDGLTKIRTVTQSDKSVPVTKTDIRREYLNDTVLSTVIQWLKDGKRPVKINHRAEPSELCHYWRSFELLQYKDGVLYRKWFNPKTGKYRDLTVIPCTLVERIIYTCHDTLATCHAGTEACIELCLRKYYFYKLKKEFKLYIASCLQCARAKQPQRYNRAAMRPNIYTEFNQAVAIDHLIPNRKSNSRGIVAILTMVDMYSNYLVCVPVKSTGADESIKAVMEHWILKHGVPEEIRHDLGSAFTSNLWKAVMKAFDIKDVKTTPKFSQSNGKAEANNRKLNQCFRTTLSKNQWNDFDIYLKYIVFSLNSLACAKTGFSPNYLVFNRELRMPRDLFINDNDRLDSVLINDNNITIKARNQAYSLYKEIADITRNVRDTSMKRAKYMKKQYDKHVYCPQFSEGDLCFILKLWGKHKYAEKWEGPYKVTQKISEHNYIVDIDGLMKVVNVSKMKLFKPNKYYKPQDSVQKRTAIPSTRNEVQRQRNSPSSSSDEDYRMVTNLSHETPRRSERIRSRRHLGVAQDTSGNQSAVENTSDVMTEVTNDVIVNEVTNTDQIGSENLESTDSEYTDALEHSEENPSESVARDAQPSESTNTPKNGGSSMNFGELETKVTLKDIEKHGKKAARASTQIMSRPSSSLDISNTRDESTRTKTSYNLRPRVKPPKKFGFPVSPKKKKK